MRKRRFNLQSLRKGRGQGMNEEKEESGEELSKRARK